MIEPAKYPRIAAVGLGHWGKNIARNLGEMGVLGVIYDDDTAASDRVAQNFPGVRTAASFQSVLNDPDIPAVMIATPAITHGALAQQALNAGKHVFVEKPLCLDVDEAVRLTEMADRKGLVLMVGHLLLHHPAFRALLTAVQEGKLGKLRYIYSNRASLGKIRREENALWSFAPHDISMILAITGRLPIRVVANGGSYLSSNVADTTLSHLDFGEGLQAHIFVSWLHPYKEQRLVVVGDQAMAVFNDVALDEDKLLMYPHQVGWDGDLPSVNKADALPIPYEAGEPLRLECETFLLAVRDQMSPVSDAEEGTRVLKVLDACQRALNSGDTIRL